MGKLKHKIKLQGQLLTLTQYIIEASSVIDSDNYYDIIKSIERKAKQLRYPS